MVKNKPAVDLLKIALIGTSKGTKYASLYALNYNYINAFVSEVGLSFIWSSKRYIKSCCSYNGKSLSRARRGLIEAIKFLKSTDGKVRIQLPYILSVFKNTKRIEKRATKIENIKGSILLISGEDDRQWLSMMMSNQIKARAEKHKFNYEINHYSYENAEH